MHAIHLEPHRILVATLAALVLALVAATALPTIGELSSSDSAPATVNVAETPSRTTTTPTWVENPMASPIATLRGQ